MKVNPEQIVYIAYQLRQTENYRDNEKNERRREALSARIRQLKAEIDPLLMAFAEEKKAEPQMRIMDDKIDNRDHGPAEVVEALHTYAKWAAEKQQTIEHLRREPVSIAGEHNGVMYVVHLEKVKS